MLAVVQDEQQLAVAQRVQQRQGGRSVRPLFNAQDGRNRVGHERGVLLAAQLDQCHAILEHSIDAPGQLQRQARLPDTARTGQRQQPRTGEQLTQRLELATATDEGAEWNRQRAGRSKGRRLHRRSGRSYHVVAPVSDAQDFVGGPGVTPAAIAPSSAWGLYPRSRHGQATCASRLPSGRPPELSIALVGLVADRGWTAVRSELDRLVRHGPGGDQLGQQAGRQLAWFAASHEHPDHRHIHVVAVTERRLDVPDFQALREAGDNHALAQQRLRTGERGVNSGWDGRRSGAGHRLDRDRDHPSVAAHSADAARPRFSHEPDHDSPSQAHCSICEG